MLVDIHRAANDVRVLRCSGDLTHGHGDATLRMHFDSLVEEGARDFVLDLSEVDYIDSAGIGEIVACSKRILSQHGLMKIVMPEGGFARRVFEITGLHRAFDVFESESEALSSFPD